MNKFLNDYIFIFIIAMTLTLTMHSIVHSAEVPVTHENPPLLKVIQDWQKEPKLPEGWVEIDRKQAKITNKKTHDVFILMTDGINDQIVWFENIGRYWKMAVIESLPTKNHLDYGVDIKKAKLVIMGRKILYGLDASEPISIFDWDAKEKIFTRYVRP